MKNPFPQIAGSIASGLGAITAWQEHIDWFFRVGASVAAIIAGVLTIASLLRKRKVD